jgi:hypothetical protein
LAVSSNEPAEIWFLQPTGSTPIVALQTYTVDLNGAETAYGPIHHLPQNIIIDSGTALSSLFLSTPNNFKKSGTLPSITGYGTSYAAWCVRFMPDGSISSPTGPATQNLFLTLHDIALGDQLTASPLPKNYALINTDYVTGAVTLYRP